MPDRDGSVPERQKHMALTEKQVRRHKWVVRIARPIIAPFIKLIFNYRFEPIKNVEGPMIVVANHNCDLDPVMVGLACPHIYFVASEHIFRKPAIAWLLETFLSPIARRKGSVDASTVMEIRSRIKAGHSIAIFPEGNRSLDGCTGLIHPTTGKLIKAFGATLVTYHLEGGFFTTPRWGFGIRKGRMTGRCVGVYPKEELKKMKPEEILELVRKDLYEDPYITQQKEKVRYRSKAPARGLETALYLCPKCKSIGTLRSTKKEIICTCGYRAKFDEYGYFVQADQTGDRQEIVFLTYTEWYRWQQTEVAKLYAAYYNRKLATTRTEDAEEEPCISMDEFCVFPNNEVCLHEVGDDERSRPVMSGVLKISTKGLSIVSADGTRKDFPFKDIPEISLCGRNKLAFICDGGYYEVKTHKLFNSRLVIRLYELINEKKMETLPEN